MKVACTVWRRGKEGDNIEFLPIPMLESIDGTKASTVGIVNPYRYRGYRYETETGLYYLQSRYYSPEWGRFINTDGIMGQTGELLSHNLFAYCSNNPISFNDKSGFQRIYMYDKGIGGLAVGGTTPSIGKGLVCLAKGIYYATAGVIGAVSGYIYKMSKGGKQRIRDTGLPGVSDEVIL